MEENPYRAPGDQPEPGADPRRALDIWATVGGIMLGLHILVGVVGAIYLLWVALSR